MFIFFVQLPLTLSYFLKIRAEPVLNRHLIKRLYILPLISLPWSYYAEKYFRNTNESLYNKYLSDLNDNQLDNFTQEFEAAKQLQ